MSMDFLTSGGKEEKTAAFDRNKKKIKKEREKEEEKLKVQKRKEKREDNGTRADRAGFWEVGGKNYIRTSFYK